MPITNGTYISPTWNNNAPPAIDSTELQAITDTTATIPTLVRPNLLNNWYFLGGGSQRGEGRFPINQRGSATYSSSGYCIDRWINTNGFVLVGTTKLTISGGSSSENIFRQVTDGTISDGTVCTLSVLMEDGTFYTASGAINSSTEDNLRSNYTNGYCSFKYGSSVVLTANANTSVEPAAVKLEVGPTQTLAHWDPTASAWVLNEVPNFKEQFDRCKRFFQRITGTTTRVVATGYNVSTTASVMVIPTDVAMRTTPTISYSGNAYLISNGTSTQLTSSNTISATGKQIDNAVGIAIEGLSGLTSNRESALALASTAYLQLSAEL